MGKSRAKLKAVKLNGATVRSVMKSPEMKVIVKGVVDNIADRANSLGEVDGFEARVRMGKNRVRGSVVSVTNKARRAEATDRALSKAIRAGD